MELNFTQNQFQYRERFWRRDGKGNINRYMYLFHMCCLKHTWEREFLTHYYSLSPNDEIYFDTRSPEVRGAVPQQT